MLRPKGEGEGGATPATFPIDPPMKIKHSTEIMGTNTTNVRRSPTNYFHM